MNIFKDVISQLANKVPDEIKNTVKGVATNTITIDRVTLQMKYHQLLRESFPDTLWDYLSKFPERFSHLPTKDNRIQAQKNNRTQIWDYFFRLDFNSIDKIFVDHISELDELIQNTSLYLIKKCEDNVQSLRLRASNIPNLDAIVKQLNSVDPKNIVEKKNSQIVKDLILKTQNTLMDDKHLDTNSQDIFSEFKEELKIWKELIQECEEIIEKCTARIEYLNNLHNDLQRQMPDYPSDEHICTCLKKDLDNIKQECIKKANIVNSLIGNREMEVYDNKGKSIREFNNPISLIMPGDIQGPNKVSPEYLPKELNPIQKLYQEHSEQIIPHLSNQLAKFLLIKPIPDLGKHFSAKSKANTSEGYEIFYGVYFIEYVMIAKHMMTLYELFFDFIDGKKFGERIVEIYYEDIVTIEQTWEQRSILLHSMGGNKNPSEEKPTLTFEDIPVLTVVLANGDRHEVTFINHSYLSEIIRQLENSNAISDEINQYINKNVEDIKAQANTMLNVLRSNLRKHKSLIYQQMGL